MKKSLLIAVIMICCTGCDKIEYKNCVLSFANIILVAGNEEPDVDIIIDDTIGCRCDVLVNDKRVGISLTNITHQFCPTDIVEDDTFIRDILTDIRRVVRW